MSWGIDLSMLSAYYSSTGDSGCRITVLPMATYRATVRVRIEAKNAASARRTLEEQLGSAGLNGSRVVNLEEEGRLSASPRVPQPRHDSDSRMNSGAALLLAAGTLAILFFLSLAWH